MNEYQLGTEGKPWNNFELDLIVRRYLQLYVRVVTGEKIVKERIYREISEELKVRSVSSVALKMSNISSVMLGLGWPHIPRLGPMPHIQNALVDHVSRGINRIKELDNAVADLVNQKPVELAVEAEIINTIPKTLKLDESFRSDISLNATRDYIQLEAKNAQLGLAGEISILEYEEKRLRNLGAVKLANRIEHVSVTKGDGLGYDIHSFEADGRDKLIEVKTTTGSNYVPFYVSRNELRVSQDQSDFYCLSRVYDYPLSHTPRQKVKFYELNGRLDRTCELRTETFAAVPNSFRKDY
ncbi:DUF3883 domain-containing protein [Streptomyces diacarni]|uniref:DUF3883 domain-containing protein n=1 Tax=Streptomyces diacarni TaxID=2800381 RepID=UPI0033EC015E